MFSYCGLQSKVWSGATFECQRFGFASFARIHMYRKYTYIHYNEFLNLILLDINKYIIIVQLQLYSLEWFAIKMKKRYHIIAKWLVDALTEYRSCLYFVSITISVRYNNAKMFWSLRRQLKKLGNKEYFKSRDHI